MTSAVLLLRYGFNNPMRFEGAQIDPLAAIHQLLRQGDFRAAGDKLQNLLTRDPENVEAHFISGMIACQSQRWADAAEHLETVVAKQPNRFEALYGLGVSKKNLRLYPDAIEKLTQATRLVPRHAAAHNELGLCQLKVGVAVQALSSFSRAVELAPGTGQILHNQGLALVTLDRVADAKSVFAQAVANSPGQAESHVQLAMVFERLGDWEECQKCVLNGLRYCAEDATLLGILAKCYAQTGNSKSAEATFQRAFQKYPALGSRYALWLQEEGKFEESLDVLWQSLDRFPVQGAAFYGLAEANTFEREGQSLFALAVTALENRTLDEKERIYLLFALGKLKEAEADYEASIGYYDQANDAAFRCFNSGRPYDRALLCRMTDRTIDRYGKETLANWSQSDAIAPQPILIVGMIRSGTTLLDQILSSHPDVKSAGEQLYWTTRANTLYEQGDRELSSEDRDRFRSEYRRVLESHGEESPRIVDKMPLNYAYLGLIHEVVPSAKIVHIRRNPIDVAMSIYTNHFGLGPNFAYNQSNIVFNQLEYLRLMEHWRLAMPPNVFYEVEYESLVRDREREVRKLIEFCELPWNDACLSHTANRSTIRTPSRWQARQKVYSSSIGRWKNFEPWLGDLLQLKGVSS